MSLSAVEKQIHSSVAALPSAALQTHILQQWERLVDAWNMSSLDVFSVLSGNESQLIKVLVGSDYVADVLCRYPKFLVELVEAGELSASISSDHYDRLLQTALADIDDESVLNKTIRECRQKMMLRVIWRDLNRLAPLMETTRDLSRFADASVTHVMRWHSERLKPVWGEPHAKNPNGELVPQSMIVLGMGKLGADELNLSSDIDLIFVFPQSGWTQNGKREISNQEFFTKLGQKLIQSLDNQTADGFVFRVDMRLRPYGESGPLVMSFNAIEDYYQSQGREWERYAMIKARVMAGDQARGAELISLLKPFVYRKYIDFSVIEALRGLKEMINREVRRKGMEHNIKLGRGGIREIEFIAQVFQLIHGGMDVRLQNRSLLAVLQLLEEGGILSSSAHQNLLTAYQFLRDTEHAIQALQDKQTQLLPEDELSRTRLALSLGCDGWDSYIAKLNALRASVEAEFVDLIRPVDEDVTAEEDASCDGWRSVWLDDMSDEEAVSIFDAVGFDRPADAWKLIKDLKGSKRVRTLQREGQERLNQFIPQLLYQLESTDGSTETLARVLVLVESVIRRTAYLVLLMENKTAFAQLIRLCQASPWISQQLAKTPVILDELINVSSLYSPPDKAELNDELRQHMLRIPEDDLEALMESLRYFKNAHVLRVAAAEVTGALPLMKASDYLTYIAEVILENVVDMAWHQMVERYGYPCNDDGPVSSPELIVVGYGKLGGIELSYGSDLDIVFIHNSNTKKYTNGLKQVDNQVFYTRLVQRVVHIMTTVTPLGDLYEIDMRLRPEGNSGMLVSSLKAFEDYQYKNAWTWEHQALVRARVVAGSRQLEGQFNQVREDILASVKQESLLSSVVDMRKKMMASLASNPAGDQDDVFHLKHDAGGMVDIEFMAQYAVLLWSKDYPEMRIWSDNIRILETLEALKLMSVEEVNQLIEAYKVFRIEGHRKILNNQSVAVTGEEAQNFSEYRQIVNKIWQHFMEDRV
ncbi:bifunctional [glutamate--ammonia ligase]-adenylyl-L-tyrosine phosphorylase/[glutamate--ammonia-ligase] adenylyltransferase [Litoribacillus peritrichatus]|uniref:Bifunctional glutamine synthetase adenylyltransferase/adenylyl-removing enzyme n=1 Tax=Litoribacillus peritrichatus TaxID=718191 RepID=A0ABP7MNR5_9GAMM